MISLDRKSRFIKPASEPRRHSIIIFRRGRTYSEVLYKSEIEMAHNSPSSTLLNILNSVHVVLALGLAATSIWFFVEIQSITNMRNVNHYLLDFNVYWPQAIPWIFILVGVLVLCVSCCGYAGAKKQNRGWVLTYITFEVIAVLGLIVATIVALALADTSSTDKFIKDIMWDAFNRMEAEHDIEKSFGLIEKRFQCCGVESPRNYKNKQENFPISCCDTYYHGWIGNYNIDCDISNKLANERHGCAVVAANYTRIAIKVLAALAAFTALIGIMNIVLAVILSRGLKKKPRIAVVQQESDSKKVLL